MQYLVPFILSCSNLKTTQSISNSMAFSNFLQISFSLLLLLLSLHIEARTISPISSSNFKVRPRAPRPRQRAPRPTTKAPITLPIKTPVIASKRKTKAPVVAVTKAPVVALTEAPVIAPIPATKAPENQPTIASLIAPIPTIKAPEILPTKASVVTPDTTSLIAQFLSPHNALRAKLGLPLLQWSNQLARDAELYAMERKGGCELVHSHSGHGENLFWGSGKQWGIADAVGRWVAENSAYDYEKNACLHNRACGHYTQMVWKETKRVGCAKTACDSGDTFIVCQYDPPGNYIGERPY